MNELALAYVKWLDIYDYTGGWHSVDDISEWAKPEWIVRQVGWIYYYDDNYLILINMIAPSMNKLAHMTKIPKACIIYMQEIELNSEKHEETV